MEKAGRKVATNTIGYTRKQAGKEKFDEESKKVDEEKNACRANAIQGKRKQQTTNISKSDRLGKSPRRLQSRLSDMEAFKTRVNSTSD
jgi:hypothetical protein